ncbi:MAG TPA: hypothetical protein PKC28_01970 [Bdellovibrionales bacterium]|nr:hypothetical protein [Bdellovibrionales bacterium]
MKSGCGASASKFIYISVRGGKLMPIVSFENMPKENLEFGKPSGEFQIVVDDPTSVKAPVLSIVSEAEAVNPESKVHDGSKGVDCDSKPAKIADNRWAFTCIFDSNLIKNIDTRLGTGQLIKAVFFAKAKSASGAAASVATPYYMMVQFPLIEKKSVTDAQPEEPKEEAVSNGIPVPTPRPSNQGAKQ